MKHEKYIVSNEQATAPALPTPEVIVLRFLRALEQQDHDSIAALLAPNLRYTNVSLPTLKGGKRVARLAKLALRPGTGFGVQIHQIASKGDVVMTERSDLLKLGPLHVRFWVCGTFVVQQGQIVLWRDYFDWWAATQGTIRGLAGVAMPRFRMRLPTDISS